MPQTDADAEDRKHDGYRLAEDFNLLNRAVNEGSYKALRYQELGYDHLWEDAIEELERIQSMLDETLDSHTEGA